MVDYMASIKEQVILVTHCDLKRGTDIFLEDTDKFDTTVVLMIIMRMFRLIWQFYVEHSATILRDRYELIVRTTAFSTKTCLDG